MIWLAKWLHKPIDDPYFEEMNPLLKLYYYESWVAEVEREQEDRRSQAILIGSFYNPEGAQKMLKRDNPDFVTSDDEQLAKSISEHSKRELEEEKLIVNRRSSRRKNRRLANQETKSN